MKQLFSIIILFFTFHAYSQDSTKVEQYCEIVTSYVPFSSKMAVEVDYGEAKSVWQVKRLKDESGKLKKFNSIIDALNYFGKQGWKLVNAFPASKQSGASDYHYVLKKEFSRSEVSE